MINIINFSRNQPHRKTIKNQSLQREDIIGPEKGRYQNDSDNNRSQKIQNFFQPGIRRFPESLQQFRQGLDTSSSAYPDKKHFKYFWFEHHFFHSNFRFLTTSMKTPKRKNAAPSHHLIFLEFISKIRSVWFSSI